MGELAQEVLPINIEDELKQSYLDYAMSVIVGRALPDVRDGMKPVHRRVLFAMSELKNDFNKPYKKSARVVGDVIGKYHPHGDSAVYDTIVRMAQPFSLRYPLVDGQGNFGSIDGDNAAAMRYTEVRMAKVAHELLADLDKETVDFVPNYDGTEHIPAVLPTRIPNLLVNGASGIAVGMATNIPPHNLKEVVGACLHLIENPHATIEELMEFVPGPDFPTAAIINGRAGIVEAYRTGRGRIRIRAQADVETNDKTGRDTIVVNEIPYQVNKARLIEKIAELVKDKKLEGISELRDESDKDGLRIVIELKRGEQGDIVLNNLFKQTQLETVFGINMVALADGQPQTLNLHQMLTHFIRHRQEVVTRRTVYLLRKARERGHILEGYAVALANIDPIIKVIRNSPSPAEAKVLLLEQYWDASAINAMLASAGTTDSRPDGLAPEFGLSEKGYKLSPVQAQAILELRLHRLTGMEHDKLIGEYKEKLAQIARFLEILGSKEELMGVIQQELTAITEEYGDERRSVIQASTHDLNVEDLIAPEERVVTISHQGYAKTQSLGDYQAQRRGGMGRSATAVKDEDFVQHLTIANTHTMMLFFTNLGKVYWLKVFQIPLASRGARGRPMVNLLNLDEGERVTSMLPVEEYTEDQFIFFATANGTVKKTPLMAFSRQRSVGLIAIDLVEDDVLVSTAITDGAQDVMLLSSEGKSVRFRESDVRSMGRTAKGVRGIRLPEEHSVLSMIIPEENGYILTVSENGYGKRTAVTEYPCKGRGGKGVIAMTCSERNGSVVGAVQVKSGDEIMLISDQGTLIRTRTDEISQSGRNTQGVRVIRVKGDENLVSMARIDESQIQEELPPEEDAEDSVSATPVSDSDAPAADGESSNESDVSSD